MLGKDLRILQSLYCLKYCILLRAPWHVELQLTIYDPLSSSAGMWFHGGKQLDLKWAIPVEQDLSVMSQVFMLCKCQLIPGQTDFRLPHKFHKTELSGPKDNCKVSVWLLC